MKIEKEKYELITSDQFEEVEFDLDPSSKQLMIEMLHSKLYSNPKGSIIRELASNCVDAHNEAGITKDFEIEYIERSKLTGQFEPCIIFRDFAGLLTPERFRDVYTKYFASSKRESDEQIGGFGLGAKTPLAYVDSFTVRVVNNKTEWVYVVTKSELGGVKLFKLTEQEIDESNTTEVIVPLNDTYDKHEFQKEIIKQLCYFKNVKYINWQIDKLTIDYEDEDIIWSSKSPHNSTHIIIGNVSYPIDFNLISFSAIGVGSSNKIALKFDIGEISLSMSRETIYYSDKTKMKIIEKLTNVQKKIFDIVKVTIDKEKNFIEVIRKLNDVGNNSYTSSLSTESLQLRDFSMFCAWRMNSNLHYDFEGVKISQDYSFLYGFTIRSVNFDYSGRVNYNFSKSNVFSFNDVYYVEGETEIKKSKCIYIKGKDDQKNKSFVIIQKNEIDATKYQDVAEYNKAILNQANVEILLKRDAINYNDYVIDESVFTTDEKKKIYSAKELREQNSAIFAKVLYFGYKRGEKVPEFTAYEPIVKDIPKIKCPKIIYGFSEDDDKLKNAASIMYNSKVTSNCFFLYSGGGISRADIDKQKFMILKISRQNEKHIITHKGAIHVNKFLMKGTEELIKFYTGYKINEIIDRYKYLSYFEPFNRKIFNKYKALLNYQEKYLWYKVDTENNFAKNVLLYCEENKVWDDKIMKMIEDVQEYCKDLGILYYVESANFSSLSVDQITVIDDLLKIKNKDVTYKNERPLSTIEKGMKKGQFEVANEFMKLMGWTTLPTQIPYYNTVDEDFYHFHKADRVQSVLNWIASLPVLEVKKEEEKIKEEETKEC